MCVCVCALEHCHHSYTICAKKPPQCWWVSLSIVPRAIDMNEGNGQVLCLRLSADMVPEVVPGLLHPDVMSSYPRVDLSFWNCPLWFWCRDSNWASFPLKRVLRPPWWSAWCGRNMHPHAKSSFWNSEVYKIHSFVPQICSVHVTLRVFRPDDLRT